MGNYLLTVLILLPVVVSGQSPDSISKLLPVRILTPDTFPAAMSVQAMDTISVPMVVPAQIIDGDTLPVIDVKTAYVYPPYQPRSWSSSRSYSRLVYNIKKVYPYAKLAGTKLKEYQEVLDTIETEKARRVYLRQAEKELEKQFGDEVKALTFSQGKILIKLIYRETGSSSFELVRELRGKFRAFIWQTLAVIFGYDLKTGYDPVGEDREIEEIVRMIEEGVI